jgi:hypothetical protein
MGSGTVAAVKTLTREEIIPMGDGCGISLSGVLNVFVSKARR